MTHPGYGANTNLTVVEDGNDLRIDDQAHGFPIVCGPEHSEGPVLLEQFDRAPTQAEAEQAVREPWPDMGDARRALRG